MHDGINADKAFETCFKNDRNLSPSLTGLIVEEVHYLIQHWRLLSEIQNKTRMGLSADAETLLGIGWIINNKPIPDIAPFKYLKKKPVFEALLALQDNPSVMLSIPDWLFELGNTELGPQWPSILKALQCRPELVVRTNTLKTTRENLGEALLARDIKTQKHALAPEALIFKNKLNVFKLPEFRQGWFEMQDISSQRTGIFANPQPGMRVIDGCAGNGGKTLHLASLMQNKGKIIAMDIFPAKLETLRCRARRAGISIIETRAIESSKTIKRLHGTTDLALLDVPCSGLGVLKRNPEIKWRLQPSDLENLRKTQEDILNRYSLMVKPGGRVVYSTCSVLPSENSQQVRKFLQIHNDAFELITEQFLSPEEGFDGFYMASLLRKA